MSRYIDYDAIDYRSDRLHDKSEEFLNGVIYMAQRIEEAPSIDIPQWIPCSKRLPSDSGEYLVTVGTHDAFVDVLYYGKPLTPNRKVKGKCFYRADDEWGDIVDDDAIAWMPLPKPYRERKESE